MATRKPAQVLSDEDFLEDEETLSDEDFLDEDAPSDIVGDLKRGAVSAIPAVGGLVGGMAGFASPVPGGTVLGAGLGSAFGKYAENIARQKFLDEPGSPNIHVEAAQEGLLGGATEGAGQLIGRGLDFMGKNISQFRGALKPEAKQILEAGVRQKVPVTQGFLRESETLGGLESSLAQSPSYFGRRMRDKYRALEEGLESGSERALSLGASEGAPLSQFEAGTQSQKVLADELSSRLAKPREFYQSYAKEVTPFVGTTEKSKAAVSNNIRNLDLATAIKGSPEEAFANQIADSIDSAKDLSQVRTIKSYVGKKIEEAQRAGNGNMTAIAGEIYGKLQRLEQKSLTRGTIEALASEAKGTKYAKKMISDLKDANKAYREIMQDVRRLSKEASLGKVQSPEFFTKKVAELPPEKLVDRFFSGGNARQMMMLKEKFPQTFGVLQKAKQADIWKKSIGPDNKISVAKMLSQVRRMTPEAREMIFGANNSVLQDIEILQYARPARMGPSGTPQGIEFMQFNPLNPLDYANELRRASQYALIENPELTRRLSEGLRGTGALLKRPGASQVPKGLLQLNTDEYDLEDEEFLDE